MYSSIQDPINIFRNLILKFIDFSDLLLTIWGNSFKAPQESV